MTDFGAEGGPSSAGPRGLAACASCQEVFPAARLAEHGGRQLCGGCARSRARSMSGDSEMPPPMPMPTACPPEPAVGRFRPRAAPRTPLCGVEQVLADPFSATQEPPRPVPALDDALPARPVLRNSRMPETPPEQLPDWARGAATAAAHGRSMSPAEAAALAESVAAAAARPGLPTGFSRGSRMVGSTVPALRPETVPEPSPAGEAPPPPASPPMRTPSDRVLPVGFQSGSRFAQNMQPMPPRPQDVPGTPPPPLPAPTPFVRGRAASITGDRAGGAFPPLAAPQPSSPPGPSFPRVSQAAAKLPAFGPGAAGVRQAAIPPSAPGGGPPSAASAVVQGNLSRASIPPWEVERTPGAPRTPSRTGSRSGSRTSVTDGVAPGPFPPVGPGLGSPVGAGLGTPLAAAAFAPSAADPAVAPPGGTDRPARGLSSATFEDYALLRQRIDGGDDTVESHRHAGDLAARLGLHLEAMEHYRRCVELDPADERSRMRLDNARLALSNGAGASPEAARAAAVPRRIQDEAQPFWMDLGSAMVYPLQGAGKSVLLLGGVLFGLADIARTANPFGLALTVMLWGYVAAYLFDVINSSGTGKTAPPDLPEPTNVLESYVFPFFASVTCGLVSFAPFVVVLWASIKGWLPGPVAVVLLVAAFALGFFVMPMTLMVRAMFQSLSEAASPSVVLGSIGRVFPDYVAMFVATCFIWIAFGVVETVVCAALWFTLGLPGADAVLQMDGSRILSWVLFTVVSWPLFLYAWMLQGHLLGRLYRQGLRRLAWFVPPSDATFGARRLSRGLAVGAGCALVALCGAAWGAGTMLQRIALHPNAAAFGASCPVGSGSSLTYFWEHTDGMAGLTTYKFLRQADGTMRVTASRKIAGQPGGESDETVGIFDPDNGIWSEAAAAWGSGVFHDGKKGMHVAFFGPKRGSQGSSYINQWVVKEPTRWRKEWQSWRVHDDVSTMDRYYDTKTGLLVGSEYRGVGFIVTEWLVSSENVPNCPRGVPPNRDFSEQAAPPNPFEGFFEGMDGR